MQTGTRVKLNGSLGRVVFVTVSSGVTYNDVLLDNNKRVNNRYDHELEVVEGGI